MVDIVGVVLAGTDQAQPPKGGSYVKTLQDTLEERGLKNGVDYTLHVEHLDGEPAAKAPSVFQRLSDAKVIVAMDPRLARFARNAEVTTPIVQAIGYKQVEAGAVISYRRPGTNVTGLTAPIGLVFGQMDLFRQVLPEGMQVAIVYGPARMEADHVAEARAAAQAAGLALAGPHPDFAVSSPSGIRRAFARARDIGAAIYLVPHSMFSLRPRAIAGLERDPVVGVPVMYSRKRFVEEGGLISWGQDPRDLVRRAATYVHRILQGVSPGDLPMQSGVLELAINFDALGFHPGVSFPRWVIGQATETFGTPTT